MDNHNLHEVMQSAYKKNHSTETALVRVQNDILTHIDNKHGVILVLLDLSAAFDTIDHKTLLLNLNLTGTLLQSIMTVTQRRGVLVKKECID